MLFEGAQAALLDVDLGVYPYVTASNSSALGVCAGTGLPPRATGSPHYAAIGRRVQGQILASQQASEEAEGAFAEAIADLDGLGSRLELGRALHHRAVARRARGDAVGADADAAKALVLFEECGAQRDLERLQMRA